MRTLIVACVVLAAVACGGGNKGSSAGTTALSGGASTAAPTSDPRTQQQIDADKAAAQTAVLKVSDFPTGWTGKPASDSGGSGDVTKQMSACVGADFAKNTNPTQVRSDDFSDPNDTMTASNSVSLEPSVEATNAAMDKFSDPKVPSCLAQIFDSVISKNLQASATTLPKGTTIGKSEAATESFPNVAERTTAFRVTLPVQASGLSLKFSFDFIAFTKGHAGATLYLQGQGSPFPADTAETLAKTVAARLPST